MRALRRGGSRDLLAACLLAAIGAAAALAGPDGWLRAVAAAPLVLAVPGYAIAAALFPPGTLAREDRVVYSFVFSLSASALGGLAAQVFLDLDDAVWVALLATLTVVASAVALRRRAARPTLPRVATPWKPSGLVIPAAGLAGALAICGVAIALATQGVHDQQAQQRFASLWAVPARSDSGRPRVEVGIWNHGGPTRYRLEAERDGARVDGMRVAVGPQGRWRARLDEDVSARDGALVISIYVPGSEKPYRSVELDFGDGSDR